MKFQLQILHFKYCSCIKVVNMDHLIDCRERLSSGGLPVVDVALGVEVPAVDGVRNTIEHFFSIGFFDFPTLRSVRDDVGQHTGSIVTYLEHKQHHQCYINDYHLLSLWKHGTNPRETPKMLKESIGTRVNTKKNFFKSGAILKANSSNIVEILAESFQHWSQFRKIGKESSKIPKNSLKLPSTLDPVG